MPELQRGTYLGGWQKEKENSFLNATNPFQNKVGASEHKQSQIIFLYPVGKKTKCVFRYYYVHKALFGALLLLNILSTHRPHREVHPHSLIQCNVALMTTDNVLQHQLLNGIITIQISSHCADKLPRLD